MTRAAGVAAVVAVSLATSVATWSASRRQSATFDEIILVSGGVRGVTHGSWDMVTDQPPLMMWLYGWATAGAASDTPPEDRSWDFEARWDYARLFFFGLENDAQRLLGRARLVTAGMAGATAAAAGGFAWWAAGPQVAVLAAVLTGLIPDVLAHGGIAYNDLPLALTFLLAVWAIDAFVRRPSPRRGAPAGFAVAATFGMKMSALALLPIAVLLLAAEAWRRRADRSWRRALVPACVGAGVAAYALLVVMYGGDLALTSLRFNFWRTVLHTTGGHPAPAYLLGEVSPGGWWYYFPVAFVFKTPVAFQLLLALGVVGLALGLRRKADRVAALLAWRGRGALVGVMVFGFFLLRSDLNAGFRYALPALPLLAVIAAMGLAQLWDGSPAPSSSEEEPRGGTDADVDPLGGASRRRSRTSRFVPVVVVGLVALQAATVASFYPHWLSFTSVWAGGRDQSWTVLGDSNVDWGQGLLELRDFMDAEGVASVSLSYFGSARPEAYGIEYVALPSFFRLSLDRTPNAESQPRFTVISANNLLGLYLQGRDPYAPYRSREPYRVLGHALFVYDERP